MLRIVFPSIHAGPAATMSRHSLISTALSGYSMGCATGSHLEVTSSVTSAPTANLPPTTANWISCGAKHGLANVIAHTQA